MVGFEGRRPIDILRIRADNPHFNGLIIRIVDLLPREDGNKWQIGDEIGLHGSSWRERGEANVYATIKEIVDD
jgi:hypothetical protein